MGKVPLAVFWIYSDYQNLKYMNTFTRMMALLLLVTGCAAEKDETGKPYPGWKQGELDIHHIHTGMGEANFFIMPDGTSMLIDAGDLGPNKPEWEKPRAFPPIADAEFHPGKYVAGYVMNVNPHGEKVDYFMSSHFHDDHLTNARAGGQMTQGRNPDYVLSGVTEAGEWLRFGKFYDRAWPDYDYPVEIKGKDVANFRSFVKYQTENFGASQERFIPGRLNQISLVHKPAMYARSFSIRNLAANAQVWTGNGEETVKYYDMNPENITGRQNENTKSIALRLDYGPFSYYTGGDVSGNLRDTDGNPVNIEVMVGQACGKVDVCKTNHHAYKDAMKQGFLEAVDPTHYVSCAWDIWHTQPELMERMLAQSEGMIFHQFLWPEFLQEHKDADWFGRLYQKGGHIVVKAYDKGRSYKIYVLDDSNEDMIVKDVFGPFSAE